jgi:hypothetical protein
MIRNLISASLLLLIFSAQLYSQRILFQSDFENVTLNADSLPQGWKKLDADSNFFGRGKSWAIRDTNQILGGDTIVNRPQAFSGKKSLHISWFSGKGGNYVSDDWVWTDSLRIAQGDSLIFMALLGNTPGIAYYVDSVQIWACSSQNTSSAFQKITTIKSALDTNINFWKQHLYDLSQFAGQKIFIAFRYYIPVENALWCNLDDMLIGNRSGSIGISNNASTLPNGFELYQNYPNPFNPSTKISYKLQTSSYISIKIHDVTGRLISELVNARQNAGLYEVEFQAGDISSGVYFYTLYVDGLSAATRTLSVVK